MSKLPVVSGLECIRDFQKIGFAIARQRGSHIVLVRENPKNTVIVPNHKELDRGTLRAIIRQADLTVSLSYYIVARAIAIHKQNSFNYAE